MIPFMRPKKRAWYDRIGSHRGNNRPAGEFPSPHTGTGLDLLGTRSARQWLAAGLRANAPGLDVQSPINLSQSFFGVNYLAINSFTSQVGQADYRLYEHDPDDPDSMELLSHYDDASQLIHQPNPDDTFGEILEQIALQYKLTGTACLWIPHDVEDEMDVPREMYVFSTASLLPQPISPDYPNGSYLVQPWYPSGAFASLPNSRGLGAVVPAEQIVRIKEPHPFFRWIGYATGYAISTQLDALRITDITRMNHMVRGFDPAGIVTFDPSVSRPDDPALRRLEAQIQNVWQGPQNAGRLVVAPPGADVKTFGTSPKDMIYEQGWEQLRDFILAANKVNPAVAGMVKDMSYATLFAGLRWFYIFGLSPFLRRVQEHFTRHVLHPFFDRSFLLQLKGQAITDENIVAEQVGKLIQAKAIKFGELRSLYNKLGFPMTLEKTDKDDEWVGAEQGGAGGPGGGLAGMLGGGTKPGQQPSESEDENAQSNPLAALLRGGQGGSESGGPDENAMQRKRPGTGGGMAGSRGPQPQLPMRKSLTFGEREDRLGGALEKYLTNGAIKPHKG